MSRWGLPSERPESYWAPWLGETFGLRPCDIGDLTPAQLDACRDFYEKRAG